MADALAKISHSVITGDVAAVSDLTRAALQAGCSAEDVLAKALTPAMDHVGAAMQSGDMFIPEVLLSARTMQHAMEIIRPALVNGGVKLTGKVIIGTVKGDLHTIGKNLVKMMLEGAGFTVVDLGMDVAPERFVEAVREENPDILAMSALLTTTMHGMGHTIVALQKAGLRGRVGIIVGGAPVTADFAGQIRADGYGSNARAAVDLARQLVAGR